MIFGAWTKRWLQGAAGMLILALAACAGQDQGSGGDSSANGGMGALSFSLEWRQPHAGVVAVLHALVQPEAAPPGVNAIRAILRNSLGDRLGDVGLFQAHPGQTGSGDVPNVPAGGSYNLTVDGLAVYNPSNPSGGTIIYSGQSTVPTVAAGTAPTQLSQPVVMVYNPGGGSNTVTIPSISAFAGSQGDGHIALTWQTPSPSDPNISHFAGVYVVRADSVGALDPGAALTSPVGAGFVCDSAVPGTLANGTVVTATGCDDKGLTNTHTYYYAAYSHDGDPTTKHLNLNPETIQSGLTPSAAALAAPTGLTPVSGDGTVSLTWTGITAAQVYHVYSLDNTPAGTPAAAPCATPVTATCMLLKYTLGNAQAGRVNAPNPSTSITGLHNGTAYFFAVTAVNSTGVESGASNVATATPQAGAASTPTGFNLQAKDKKVTVGWNAETAATQFNIYYGTSYPQNRSSHTNFVNVTNNGSGTTNSFDVLSLNNGSPLVNDTTTYYFSMTAQNAGGESAETNILGAIPTATIVAATAPQNLSAQPGDNQVVLNWSPPISGTPGAYRIYRGIGSVTISPSNLLATVIASLLTLSDNAAAHVAPPQNVTFSGGTVAPSNGNSYVYIVTACALSSCAGGESTQSNTAPATPSATPPGAPSNLGASSSSGTVVLTWNPPVSGGTAASYKIYRGQPSTGVVVSSSFLLATVNAVPGTTTPATAFTDSPTTQATPPAGVTLSNSYSAPVNGFQYLYLVTASNSGGESGQSNQASGAPSVQAPNPPSAPSSLPTSGGLQISWGASAGATSYNIYYGLSPAENPGQHDNPPINILSSAGVQTYTYTVTSLTPGSLYYFGITALNGTAESSPAFGSNYPLAAVPANAFVSAVGNLSVTLGWTASTGASQYTIYYSQSPSVPSHFSYQYAAFVSTTSACPTPPNCSWTVQGGLTNNNLWYFTVTASNGIGGESLESGVVAATPSSGGGGSLSPPFNYGGTGLDSFVTLSWSTSFGATGYRIYYNTSPSIPTKTSYLGQVNIVQTQVPSVCPGSVCNTSIGGFGVGTQYNFVVTATGTGVESAESGYTTVTLVPSPPPQPTLIASTTAPAQLFLSWQTQAGMSYKVYRDTYGGVGKTSPTLILTQSGAYTDSVSYGIYYCYAVSTVANGQEGDLSATNCDTVYPPAPSLSSFTSTGTQVNLTANSADGNASFVLIYYGQSPNVINTYYNYILAYPPFPSTVSFGVPTTGTWYFAAQAYDNGYGNVNTEQPFTVGTVTGAGTLDTSFNGNGYTTLLPSTTAGSAVSAKATAVAVDSSSRVTIAGKVNISYISTLLDHMISARWSSAGGGDGSFGDISFYTMCPEAAYDNTTGSLCGAGTAPTEGRAMVVDPEGRLVVVGTAFDGSVMRAAVWRLKHNSYDGQQDLTFGPNANGIVYLGTQFYSSSSPSSSDAANAVAIIGSEATIDEVIVIGGRTVGSALATVATLWELDHNGTPTSGAPLQAFSPPGMIFECGSGGGSYATFGSCAVPISGNLSNPGVVDEITGVIFDDQHRVVFVGTSKKSDGTTQAFAARVNHSGGGDATFGFTGGSGPCPLNGSNITICYNALGGQSDAFNGLVWDATHQRLIVVGSSVDAAGLSQAIGWGLRYEQSSLDGLLDTVFGSSNSPPGNGIVHSSSQAGSTTQLLLSAVTLDHLGNIVIAGTAIGQISGGQITQASVIAVRLNYLGSSDLTFGNQNPKQGVFQFSGAAFGSVDAGTAIAEDPVTHNIVISGFSQNSGGNENIAVWRLLGQ